MRKNLKSLAPALWLVIFAFILSIFFVWGKGGGTGVSRSENIIAHVGKEKISADTYINNLRFRIESLKQQFKELDANFIQQLNIPQQTLEETIKHELVLQTARRLGVKATDSEIREKVLSYPVFQKEGKFIGFDEYKKILEWNRTTVSDFEESIAKDIIIEKTIQLLTASASVTKDELWEHFKKNNESAELEYLFISSDKIEIDEQPSEETLKDFFNENKEKYKIPERRIAEYVFLDKEDLKKQMYIKESEIEKYYESNKDHFKEPEKRGVKRIFLPFGDEDKNYVLDQSNKIAKELDQGESFADLAKKYSKDEKAENNGDWGYFEWKKLSPKEQEIIQELNEKEVSDPLELEEGLSILKVSEIIPAHQLPLEEVKNRIDATLKDNKTEEMVDKKVSQLQKTALKEKSLDVAAQKLGYKIKSTGPLELGEGIDEIDPSGSLSQMLFNMEEKEISSPINTYKGIGLSQLIKIEPTREATFAEVEQKVKNDYFDKRKEQKAFEQAVQIKQNGDNVELKEVASKNNFEHKTAQNHKKEQDLSLIGENPEIDRLAFSLPLNQLSEPVQVKGGAVLLRVNERKEVTQEEFNENFEKVRSELLNTKQNKLFQSIYLKMRENLGVKTNYELFSRINSEIISRYQSEDN
ncbi:MAG: peptidyl-prolyl cis-trans isomerase [Acidobacteriota bacterium]